MDLGGFLSSGDVTLDSPGTGSGPQLIAYSPNAGTSSRTSSAIGDRKSWGFAALNVGVWNTLVFVGLAIPVASFVASFQHTPEQQPDYTWVWSYNVPIAGVQHTAELHGKYIDGGVRWEMYISKEGEYSDFQWFHGESDLPATEGLWILKNKPADPSDLLRIDWHRDIAAGTSDIRYTNIVPGGPETGGYIFYGVDPQKDLGHLYDIYNKGKDNHTEIEWNQDTQEGRVRDARFFGDSEWHCWDGDHKDTACGETAQG
jgi:hypothetical protein